MSFQEDIYKKKFSTKANLVLDDNVICINLRDALLPTIEIMHPQVDLISYSAKVLTGQQLAIVQQYRDLYFGISYKV